MGREQELSLLLDRWAETKEGHRQALLLSGEAGMGKSRLVQALRDQLAEQPFTWLEGRCSPYHQNSAFYPVIEFLEQGLPFRTRKSPSPCFRRSSASGPAFRGAQRPHAPSLLE